MTRMTAEDVAKHQARMGKQDAFQSLIERNGFNPHESVDHQAVAGYLNALGLFWLHIANEGKRSPKQGARLKQLGMLPGAADILIFDAPPLHPCVKGVVIEMKRQKGGILSDEQAYFLDRMMIRGWITKVCNGANEALDFLRSLGWRLNQEG